MSYPNQPGYQYPGYSQPGYPGSTLSPAPHYPAPRVSTTGPKVMTFLGILGVILGVCGIIGGYSMVDSATDALSKIADEVSLDRAVLAGTTSSVDLSANTTYGIMLVGGDPANVPQIQGPDGGAVRVDKDKFDFSTHSGGELVSSGGTFTTSVAGTYKITPTQSIGGVVIVPDFMAQLEKGGLGIILMVGTAIVGAISTILLVWGLIWWASRAKKARRARYA